MVKNAGRTASGLAAMLVVAMLALLPSGATAQGPEQAGLVVRFGDGSVVTRCVTLDQPEISGYELLLRSGLEVVTASASGIGTAVCSIEDEGCLASDCFCQCKGISCAYWSYWHLRDGVWSYSIAGAQSARVRPGDVQGWSWGTQNSPPVLTIDQICAPTPTASPLPTAIATGTPTPVPTSSPGAVSEDLVSQPRASRTVSQTSTSLTATLSPWASPAAVSTATADSRPTTAVETRTRAVDPTSVKGISTVVSPPPFIGTLVDDEISSDRTSNYIVFGAIMAAIAVAATFLLRRK